MTRAQAAVRRRPPAPAWPGDSAESGGRPVDLAGGGRELAVLLGGPLDRCWFWRDDLQRTRAAAERMAAVAPAPAAPSTTDIRQQRCGHADCNAWRLSEPGTGGARWRPCWKCRAEGDPVGEQHSAAAAEEHTPARRPAACLDYVPTDHWADSPLRQYGRGRVWSYAPTQEHTRATRGEESAR